MCYVFVFMWLCFFFFKQKTAYELRISDWSSDVCSSDLREIGRDLEAFAFLNVQHQGARNTRFDTAAADNRHLAAYTLVNARVGVSAPNWSVDLFAENLGRSRGQTNRLLYPFSLNDTTQEDVFPSRSGSEQRRVGKRGFRTVDT